MSKQLKQIKFGENSDTYEIVDATSRTNIESLTTQKESVSNKVTVISATSTDDQYPTAKAVYTLLDTIADEIAGI